MPAKFDEKKIDKGPLEIKLRTEVLFISSVLFLCLTRSSNSGGGLVWLWRLNWPRLLVRGRLLKQTMNK